MTTKTITTTAFLSLALFFSAISQSQCKLEQPMDKQPMVHESAREEAEMKVQAAIEKMEKELENLENVEEKFETPMPSGLEAQAEPEEYEELDIILPDMNEAQL